MAATKFIDAIARLPDCDGEDSEAMSAYTQVKLDEAQHLLGKGFLREAPNYEANRSKEVEWASEAYRSLFQG